MNLKTYLKDQNLTQKEFASIIDCTRAYISMLCRKKVSPSKYLAMEICRATGGQVTVGELLELRLQKRKEKEIND